MKKKKDIIMPVTDKAAERAEIKAKAKELAKMEAEYKRLRDMGLEVKTVKNVLYLILKRPPGTAGKIPPKTFPCPFCGNRHQHGNGDGHHVAHCTRDNASTEFKSEIKIGEKRTLKVSDGYIIQTMTIADLRTVRDLKYCNMDEMTIDESMDYLKKSSQIHIKIKTAQPHTKGICGETVSMSPMRGGTREHGI